MHMLTVYLNIHRTSDVKLMNIFFDNFAEFVPNWTIFLNIFFSQLISSDHIQITCGFTSMFFSDRRLSSIKCASSILFLPKTDRSGVARKTNGFWCKSAIQRSSEVKTESPLTFLMCIFCRLLSVRNIFFLLQFLSEQVIIYAKDFECTGHTFSQAGRNPCSILVLGPDILKIYLRR